MRAKIYTETVRAVLIAGEHQATDATLMILGLAEEVDRLRNAIVGCSRDLAERFATYADEVEFAAHDRTPPTGYSTLEDVKRHSALLEANRRFLLDSANAILGEGTSRKIVEGVNERLAVKRAAAGQVKS